MPCEGKELTAGHAEGKKAAAGLEEGKKQQMVYGKNGRQRAFL